MGSLRILDAGDSALLIETDGLDAVMGLYASIEDMRRRAGIGDADAAAFAAVRQVIPAARTVLLEYEPSLTPATSLGRAIHRLDVVARTRRTTRTVVIPVIYDGDDLESVAQSLGMSVPSLVAWHTQEPWEASFAGFAPGFVYLTGGSRTQNVSRRERPRLSVPAGSVGLAGRFSGVYPRISSGGWQLIGTTDMTMWDDRGDPPSAISPGDHVLFSSTREHIDMTAARGLDDTPKTETVGHASPPNAALRVTRPGMLALMEDDGRVAAHLGVTGSGSADRAAAHDANALVGNDPGEPVIELTGGNAAFAALRDVVLAVTGAPVEMTIRSGRDVASDGMRGEYRVERQEAFLLRSGESVVLGAPSSGFRNYCALQGGFIVDRVLGSASSDTMAHLGPSLLAAGDVLSAANRRHRTVGLPMPWPTLPRAGGITELDMRLGPRDDWFTEETRANLPMMTWTVTTRSNRVGLRLHGDVALRRRITDELMSEATVPGSIQVPADGQPVLFLCDQPVTGGYPVIGVLTAEALATAAQLPFGAKIRLMPLPSRRQATHSTNRFPRINGEKS